MAGPNRLPVQRCGVKSSYRLRSEAWQAKVRQNANQAR